MGKPDYEEIKRCLTDPYYYSSPKAMVHLRQCLDRCLELEARIDAALRRLEELPID